MLKASSGGAICVELWSFYCKKRILVPMSYITFFDEWRSSCRRSRPGGRLWHCPLICSLFTHLRQVDLRSTCKSTSSAQASVLTHNKRDEARWWSGIFFGWISIDLDSRLDQFFINFVTISALCFWSTKFIYFGECFFDYLISRRTLPDTYFTAWI